MVNINKHDQEVNPWHRTLSGQRVSKPAIALKNKLVNLKQRSSMVTSSIQSSLIKHKAETSQRYEWKQIPFNSLRPRKMAAVSPTTLLNAFSWMKMLEFWLKFHWSLFLRVQLTIFQNWFRWWLGAVQATSHYLNQWWLVYWRIYASLGLNELRKDSNSTVVAMGITMSG